MATLKIKNIDYMYCPQDFGGFNMKTMKKIMKYSKTLPKELTFNINATKITAGEIKDMIFEAAGCHAFGFEVEFFTE